MTLADGTPAEHTAGVAPRTDTRRILTGLALTGAALLALGATMLYPVAWTFWLSLNGPNTAMRGTADFRGLTTTPASPARLSSRRRSGRRSASPP